MRKQVRNKLSSLLLFLSQPSQIVMNSCSVVSGRFCICVKIARDSLLLSLGANGKAETCEKGPCFGPFCLNTLHKPDGKKTCTCKHCCLCVKCCHLLGFIRRHSTSSRPHASTTKIEQFWQGTSCCMVPRWCYQARSGQASTDIHLGHCQTDSTLHSHWEGSGTTQIWSTEEDKPTWRSSHWTTSLADKNSLFQHHSKAREGGC